MAIGTAVWKLHAGLNGDGALLEPWRRSEIVTVGFSAAEPVSELSQRDLVALFAERGRRGAGQQIVTFRDVVELGDVIVAPARQLGICCLATITGPYRWSSTPLAGNHQHARSVRWLREIELSALPPEVDRAVRHRWTLSRLPDDVAQWFLSELGTDIDAEVPYVLEAVLVELETMKTSAFTRDPVESIAGERRESALSRRYCAHLEGQGHSLRRWCIPIPGELSSLVTDIYDEHDVELYEAKATASRDAIRLAIGQLLDYRRHIRVDALRLAVLVPQRPNDDLLDLLGDVGIGCVYETPTGEYVRMDRAEK